MRTFWIALFFVLVGLAGYSYSKDPDGCKKIAHDFGDLFAAISPIQVQIKGNTSSSNDTTSSANDTTSSDTTPAAPPAPPAPAAPVVLDANVTGLIPSMINGKLIANGGGGYNFPAAAPLSSVRYFAIYYSAAWCPPCHAFTPELVQWYNGFKPSHPDFDLIFVSEDHDANAQLGYMKEMNMPWPAIRYSELKHDGNGTFKGSGIEQYAGDGIPDLVLVDVSGKVLLDSYQNGTYVGPEQVMNAIAGVVGH